MLQYAQNVRQTLHFRTIIVNAIAGSIHQEMIVKHATPSVPHVQEKAVQIASHALRVFSLLVGLQSV